MLNSLKYNGLTDNAATEGADMTTSPIRNVTSHTYAGGKSVLTLECGHMHFDSKRLFTAPAAMGCSACCRPARDLAWMLEDCSLPKMVDGKVTPTVLSITERKLENGVYTGTVVEKATGLTYRFTLKEDEAMTYESLTQELVG